MPSFRKLTASGLAHKAIYSKLTTGVGRKDAAASGKIASLGTARTYADALKTFIDWQVSQGVKLKDAIRKTDEETVARYQEMRAFTVGQKQLDKDRQALELATGRTFERAESQKETAKESRYISTEQAALVAEHQLEKNALATAVAREAGLRSSELATIRRLEERLPDERNWREDRWAGKENWRAYTVQGKGGLLREVRLSPETAKRLETARLNKNQVVKNRGIEYRIAYAIGHGMAWAKSFEKASMRALGWSVGAHGCRHGYAQDRMENHFFGGKDFKDALEAVSQELGHFHPDTTRTYLR